MDTNVQYKYCILPGIVFLFSFFFFGVGLLRWVGCLPKLSKANEKDEPGLIVERKRRPSSNPGMCLARPIWKKK